MIDSPRLHVESGIAHLSGEWTLSGLQADLPAIRSALDHIDSQVGIWDLQAVSRLDSAAAVMLWRAWQGRWPEKLLADAAQRAMIERVAAMPFDARSEAPPHVSGVVWLGQQLFRGLADLGSMLALYGQLLLDLAYLCRHPSEIPWRELSANIHKSGAMALPVTALVGFLIGITISYLSALQLKTFGADLFIVNILGIGIIRELGPVLVAVLVAGRSGSAMTAQIGVMRVTEEIDALSTMGISRSQRIVLPKVLGLTLVMPLLVLWTSSVALLGGMLAALLQLDLSVAYFIEALPGAVPVANLYIGMGKGLAFGFVIAIVACHFGLHVKPNTESLAAHTTRSVVTSITTVILVDAVFAVLTRQIGVPI